ncbi:MAG: type IX secretion system membrane protein PorP/SprF [Bacteroidetes bacterium]|nr:type IX secretion system membrane protein PorP/SprF [Bacteroidota bacterium]
MNKFIPLTILTFLMGTSLTLKAQNPRMALYESSPLNVNPAYTGYYNGKIRLGAHASMMQTDTSSMVHTNTSLELRTNYDENDPLPQRYLAVGFNFYRYAHPSNALSGAFPSLSLAYHTYLDRRRRHGISGGAQFTYAMGQYNADGKEELKPDPQIFGGGFAIKGFGTQATLNYANFAVGGIYAYKSRDFELEAGVAMYNLFYPKTDIFRQDLETRQRHRGVFSLKLGLELNQTKRLYLKTLYWRDGLYWLSTSLTDPTGAYRISGWLGAELINRPLIDKKMVYNYGIYTRALASIMPVVESVYKNLYSVRLTYEYPFNSKDFDAYRARSLEIAFRIFINPRGRIVPFTED